MAGILQRLVQLGRVHLNDFLAQRWPGASSRPTWDTDFSTQGQTRSDAFDPPPPFEEPAPDSHGLPYSEELARGYRLLDLPFGVPIEQVARRWKAYLKKSHPDLHAKDPAKQTEATVLTQQLNDAYKKIRVAWKQHRR